MKTMNNKKVQGISKTLIESDGKIKYTDLIIEVEIGKSEILFEELYIKCNGEILFMVTQKIERLLKVYSEKGIDLSVKIIHIGVNHKGKFDVAKGVNEAFDDVLRQLKVQDA